MKLQSIPALDRRVAIVLHAGTWLASGVIVVGLVLPHGVPIVTIGIALFVALPILRVALVLVDSLRARDHRIAAICTAVLLIIAVGVVLSVRH